MREVRFTHVFVTGGIIFIYSWWQSAGWQSRTLMLSPLAKYKFVKLILRVWG